MRGGGEDEEAGGKEIGGGTEREKSVEALRR